MMKVEFTKNAEKDIGRLDKGIQLMIRKNIKDKLLTNPEYYLVPLVWNLTGKYKFRIWTYRVICEKHYDRLVILVIRIKHRKDVYR